MNTASRDLERTLSVAPDVADAAAAVDVAAGHGHEHEHVLALGETVRGIHG